MADLTARFSLAYPEENQNPWFDTFKSLMDQIDSELFALHEDRNLIVYGGGTLGWDGADFSWDANIVFLSPTSGKKMTLSIADSPQTVNDGEILYVVLSRGPSASVTIASGSILSATTVPVSGSNKAIGYRSGTDFYLFNGIWMVSGETYANGIHTAKSA